VTQINDVKCPFCGNDDGTLIERSQRIRNEMNCICIVCAKAWTEKHIAMEREPVLSGKRMAS